MSQNKIAVVKYGGHAMDDARLNQFFARSVREAGENGWSVAVGHGGGPQINTLLKKLDIASSFKNGLRVTPPEAMKAVEMALAGEVNTWLVSLLCREGVRAVGLTGKDCAFLRARKNSDPELGLVGEVCSVDPLLCRDLMSLGYVPVIAPIGSRADGEIPGESLNINADTATGAVAGALRADAFLLVTDVPGVLDAQKKRLPHLTRADVAQLMNAGVITGGMIPKVESCLHALSEGCRMAVIFDGSSAARLAEMLHSLALGDLDGIVSGTVVTED